MHKYQHRMLGRKYYEEANHPEVNSGRALGNPETGSGQAVLAVVTDRKMAVEGATGQVGHYDAEVVKATDYYPFGLETGGTRTLSANVYRYGFNGKENDRDEWGSTYSGLWLPVV